MAEVTLGGFDFDPVDPSDFRVAIEGASKTGKSNTLAVMMEDLAGTRMPTLIIERLGILSTVRKIDDSIIVVGGREEAGIDLAIPSESLDVVADMVLNRGLKVLLDVSTYESDDPDDHPEHRATARVVKALNDTGQELLRSGQRRKCLLVVDEVHYLAPENNAPIIDVDEDVRRARAQLVKVATEGGNKGINFAAAYQRRAYTSKGVVSQMDNYIIHRLHRTDRSDASKEIGVSEEDIADLDTGQVFIYGDFTKQRVVGPEQVRPRTSPDPREEQFELPEPPDELSETLAEIGEEVGEIQEQREQQQERIQQLESRLESLQDRNQELEEQVRTADVLEKIAEGGTAPNGEMREVAQQVDELQERIQSVREERDQLIEENQELQSEIDSLETELAEKRELEVVKDEVVSSARTILRQFGELDLDAEEAREELQDMQDRIEELERENQRLRQQGGPSLEPLSDYEDFLDEAPVQDAVQDAMEQQNARKKTVRGIIAAILSNNGPATYSEIADRLGYSTTSTVSTSASALESVKVVEKLEVDGEQAVDLNTDGLNEIRFAAKRRQDTEERMEELDI